MGADTRPNTNTDRIGPHMKRLALWQARSDIISKTAHLWVKVLGRIGDGHRIEHPAAHHIPCDVPMTRHFIDLRRIFEHGITSHTR